MKGEPGLLFFAGSCDEMHGFVPTAFIFAV